jgi:LysR family transcriptional regulator, regulator of abg operon
VKLATLKALVAAIEEGSLRAAARRVGVSQPALTKMIRELERELATTLLARSTTGVVATAQGKVLYERACAADRELGQAVDQIRQLGGRMVGDLTIGAVPLAVMLLIPETLRTFGSTSRSSRGCARARSTWPSARCPKGCRKASSWSSR